MKKTDFRTKRKAQQEATSNERQREIADFLYEQYLNRAKARKIIEEFFEEKEDPNNYK